MSDLVAQLNELHKSALDALARATTTEETKAWHADFLGRKGRESD